MLFIPYNHLLLPVSLGVVPHLDLDVLAREVQLAHGPRLVVNARGRVAQGARALVFDAVALGLDVEDPGQLEGFLEVDQGGAEGAVAAFEAAVLDQPGDGVSVDLEE